MRDGNILLWAQVGDGELDVIAEQRALTDGEVEFAGARYPVLRSEPFAPWPEWRAAAITPYNAELITAALYGFGSGARSSHSIRYVVVRANRG